MRIHDVNDRVLAYERVWKRNRILVALNMTEATQVVNSGTLVLRRLLSTYLDDVANSEARAIMLRPNEGLILELEDAEPAGVAS